MLSAYMGQSDGKLKDGFLYTTSDSSFAAYLLIRKFELLGCYDTGDPRLQYGITATDPYVLDKMSFLITLARDEFENATYPSPHTDVALNFRDYARALREVRHALREPIRRDL